MNIAMISLYLPSETKMGVGYQAHAMANALVSRGHSVALFTPCAKPADAQYNIRPVAVGNSLRTFRFAWNLRKIDFSGFDVIHAHGDNYWLWSRRRRPPVVRTMHGSCLVEAKNVPGLKEKLRMVLLYAAELLATVVADKTVCVSADTLKYYPGLKTVIPNGVDVAAYAAPRFNDQNTGRDGGFAAEGTEMDDDGGSPRRNAEATTTTDFHHKDTKARRHDDTNFTTETVLADQPAGRDCDDDDENSPRRTRRNAEATTTYFHHKDTKAQRHEDTKDEGEITGGGPASRQASPAGQSSGAAHPNNAKCEMLNAGCGDAPAERTDASCRGKAATPTILFVGTYHNRKRGKLLMDVFARDILPKLPEVQLWMVCSDAPAAPGVTVFGRVSQEKLITLYQQAWAFCLPSTYEGFGIPYIEAMAAGTAVVASPNVGAVEVTRNGQDGLIAADDKLGDTLLNVLMDENLRQKLEAAGLERVKDFDLNSVCQRYENIYAAVAAKRDRAAKA